VELHPYLTFGASVVRFAPWASKGKILGFNEKKDGALLALGQELKSRGYRFVAPTPLTQARVLRRPSDPETASLRDVFGWNRVFAQKALPPSLFELLAAAGALASDRSGFRSRIRFSTLNGMLFLHSGFPTTEADAVFFGPDTYRFARAIALARHPYPEHAPKLILDIGAGSGAGGLVAARAFGLDRDAKILLTDINTQALRYCAINAALNGFPQVDLRESDVLAKVPESPDLILANPPYLVDAKARTYRHGGGEWGTDLSCRILEESLQRLPPQGILVLYAGTPVVDGVDMFHRDAVPLVERSGRPYRYVEMDTDVFGEELESPPYDAADRIAAIALIAGPRLLDLHDAA
jgi:hypothetical protein